MLGSVVLHVTIGPYEPNWNKLPCCSVNNTWHVCPYLRPWLWLGKILRVDFKANEILEPVSQPFLSACVEMSAATGGAPGPQWWKDCFLLLLQELAKQFGPEQPFQHCVGACNFWQETNISIFSQKVRERAAGQLYEARLFSQQPSSFAVSCWPSPHRAASNSCLCFNIHHCLQCVGTPIVPHRCC